MSNLTDAELESLANSEPTAINILRFRRIGYFKRLVDDPAKIYLNQNKKVPQSILDIRQKLCDLPETSSPSLDFNGELIGFEWPGD